MPQVDFPESLFEHVRAQSCVLCTGVRFAQAAGMPDWDALFAEMKDKLEGEDEALDELLEQGKLLTVAGHLKRKLGPEACSTALQEAFGKEVEPSDSHKILGEIPFHGAVTTGYDTLLEGALKLNGSEPTVYTYADGPALRIADRLTNFVVKAHGDVAHSVPLVLSSVDFKHNISPNLAYRAFMEDLYRTETLLLVGFRVGDPDFVLLLERLMGSFRESATDHYALLPDVSAPVAEDLYANYRLKVISYEEGDDPVASLAEALDALRDQWKSKGQELPGPDDPQQQAQLLTQQLARVPVRLDTTVGAGQELSEARLSAITAAAEQVELDNLDAESLCRLGNVHVLQDDVPKGLMCFEMALSKDAELAAAHLNLHHACAETGRFEDALAHLNKAIELDPSMRVVPERYELQAVIGRGTSGTIYAAKDTAEDRQVVVKVLRMSFVREHVSPELWLEQTLQVQALSHPNLTNILDAMIEGGRCLVVTEHLQGKDLGQILGERGTLPPEAVSELLLQVCKGLQYAHEQGINHLDITPGNIFITEEANAVLMDFRSGRATRGRRVAVKRGSEGYQAPELLAGAGGDARSDIYSLGAVLYTMSTGKVPIGSFLKVNEVNPAAKRFDALITRALRAQPEERPQSVELFAKSMEGGEEVALPESADDLDGWLEVLTYQPEHEQALANLKQMEEGFRAEEDLESLLALLVGKVEVATSPEERVRTLREVSGIFENQVGDLRNAFATLQAAFREDTGNMELRQDLERLAAGGGMWNELLQEYNQQVQALHDPSEQCDWYVHIGTLYAREMKYDDYALASFNQALALDATRIDALNEVVEVYRRKEDHKQLARSLAKLADLEPEKERQVELLRESAQIYLTELDSDAQAIMAYRKALEVDPANAQAVAALEGLFRKAEMWEELAALLKERLELTEVAEDARRFRHSLAEILGDKLDQPDEAISHFQELISADPEDHAALQGLEKLYDATGRGDEYMAILDKRIAAAETDEEKVTLCRRMAAEWEDKEGGQTRAAEYLEKIVEITGGDDKTFRGLIRLYWEVPDHTMLAEAYNRQIAITTRSEDKTSLYPGLGKVYEDHLNDPAKAIEAYTALLELEENNKIALAALSRLYQKTEDWKLAAQMLERVASVDDSIEAQAAAFHMLGVVQWKNLDLAEEAEVSLVKALELQDNYVPAMLGLAELYKERKDFGKSARMMHEAALNTANELDKIQRLHDCGATYQDDLEDEEQAQAVLEELIGLDPEHVEAGERLVELYDRQETWEKAEGLLEMLVRKADPKDRKRLVELNQRLGLMASRTGNEDRALEAFRASYDLDPTNQTSLQRLAGILYKREELEEAAKLFQALLVHRRDTLDPEDTVAVFHNMGDIKERQGEKNKALNMFEKALDLDPANEQVLERAVRLYEEKDDLEAVLRCQRNLFNKASDDDHRAEIAENIGDLLREKLKRPNDAVKWYKRARDLKPDSRRVLNKIMEVYIEQKKWEEAIKAMGKIEDYEKSPMHRSRLHYTAAVIYRDELHKEDMAVHHFDQALVKDPSFLKAFEALKRLYIQRGAHDELAKTYHLTLQRLPENTPKAEQAELWHELGVICQEQLQDAGEAIVAFEVADKLDPSNADRKENLAQLLAGAGPEAYPRAVEVHHRLLELNPGRLHTYQELGRLYDEMKQLDPAWCVSAVLAILNQASDEEQALYKKYRSDKPRRLTQKLTADIWSNLIFHPDQSRILNAVFAAAGPIVAPMAVRPAKSYGLREAEKLNLAEDKRPWAKVAQYVGQALGRAPDKLYLQGKMTEPLSLVLAGTEDDVQTVLRVNPQLIKSASEQELLFAFGTAYALLRPEHLLYFTTQSATVLQAVALACLRVVDPGARLSGDTAEVEKLATVLKAQLAPGALDFMSGRVKDLRAAAAPQEVQRWMGGVELSVARAGMLLCDDLATAAKLVGVAPDAQGMPARDRVQALLAYAVSEPYFKLREQLGLAVK